VQRVLTSLGEREIEVGRRGYFRFRSASIVSAERVVFNIKGNDYRLVVAINYHYRVLPIIWLSAHAQYDKIDVAKVTYEKERYADPADSK
jgi:mRNA interferase HigB